MFKFETVVPCPSCRHISPCLKQGIPRCDYNKFENELEKKCKKIEKRNKNIHYNRTKLIFLYLYLYFLRSIIYTKVVFIYLGKRIKETELWDFLVGIFSGTSFTLFFIGIGLMIIDNIL